MHKKRLLYSFLMISAFAIGQKIQTIPLQADTSGYLEGEGKARSLAPTMMNSTMTTPDVIPTINGELNVNGQGALVYTIPIEVFKGVNSFQPNLALAYSSDGGNGQAGYGWNIVGLSVITQGGKSKHIDGIYEGPQFDGTDPYYLDGQRLIQVGTSADYQTERFSHIKIRKINTSSYSFRVQYPDGKIAKYKEVVSGQHYIALMEDAYGNQVEYNYTTSGNTPYIDTIKYGKISGTHPFTITFVRGSRNQSIKVWRNGIQYSNDLLIKEIQVSSLQEGLYRKYILTHDITSLGQERLRIVDVENGQGERLKPLEFAYNTSDGRTIEFRPDRYNPGLPSDSEKIGGVTMGDFYGDGKISSVYWVSRGAGIPNQLINSKNGVLSTNPSNYQPSLYTGKIIQANGRFGERDQLIEFSSELLSENVFEDGLYFPRTKITIKSKDLCYDEIHEATVYLRGSFRVNEECEYYDYYGDWEEFCYDELTRVKKIGHRYVADFNNDGLVDILIAQNSMKGSPVANPNEDTSFQDSPSRTVFIEIGKYLRDGGNLNYEVFEGEAMPNGQVIEFNGDGIPEILEVDKNTKKITVYKLNFSNLTITKPLEDYELTDDFTDETPLIYGDFNGDGLTDFITPERVFKIDKDEGITAQMVVDDIETSSLIWHQYINQGNTFARTTRNFTNAKLAYCAPASSYHHIRIHRSSFWQKLWSGTPDRAEYITSDFGASTVIPLDFNNDGKTDLATFKKFGRMKFEGDKIMESTNLENLNLTVNESVGLDQECYDDCRQECYYNGTPSHVCEHACYSACQIINSSPTQIVNNVVFHENIYDESNEFSFLSHDGDESVPIGDVKMSPYSFFINSQQNNGLESYQNKLVLYDPYTRKNHEFKINSDNFLENQISSINNNSGVVEAIQYSPLQDEVQVSEYVSAQNYFYAHKLDEFGGPYPYYVHKQVPLKLLVSAVHTLFDEGSLTRQYRYENAIQHLDGLGFLGFQKTYVSDVYETDILTAGDGLIRRPTLPKNIFDDIFWTVNTHDPTQENQLIKATYGSQTQTFLTETTMDYQRHERSNNRYLYLNTSEISTDHLKGITISKTHEYNSDLLLETTTTQYDNVGTSVTSFQYQSSWLSGEHFYHGRINRNETTTNAYGDTFSTRDEYSNFNNAGVPEVQDKYGNGTEAISTTTTHDDFGNKTSESITASGVGSLSTSYDYDATKRFVTEVTNPEGQVASSVVNVHGWIEEETSELGLTTTHTYDGWGNPLSSTDYLGVTTTLVKEQLSNGKYSLSTTTPGQPQTIVIFDKFGRQIQSKTQSINNQWVVVDTEYDIYGKQLRQSEPYFEGQSAGLWNHTEYDGLDRPVLQTMYNGKVITTCYKGLTVTVEDDEQKRTKRVDAMGNTVYHKDFGGAISYSYYANGTLKEANYDGIKIKIEQDGWGNKTKLDDPSAGIYEYEYDAFGRKLSETSPKGVTTYVYDEFGKLMYENTTGDFTNIGVQYDYDSTTKLPTRIIGSNGSDSFVYETFYDEFFRIEGKKETHPQFTYETSTQFDGFGRPDVITTETMVNTIGETINTTVKNNYDGSGILKELKNNATGQVLWSIANVNAKGLTTQMAFGNGYQINTTYNDYYLPENITHENSTTDQFALDIDYDFDDVKALLVYRKNNLFNKTEGFEYDDLYRLTTEILNGNIVNQYAYDKRGRITHSTEIGAYEYNPNNFQVTKLKLNTVGKALKDDRGFANATYNSYKKAVNIHLENKERINFVYNLFKDRTAMYYGSEDEDKMARPYRKYYSADKAVEIKHDVVNNNWEVLTYLDGDPYAANVVQKNTFPDGVGSVQAMFYLHRDYQATIMAVSTQSGDLLEQRFFDAWGNLKEVIDESNTLSTINNGSTYPLFLDRGYTGHEHLQGVGLIHMNGRLYDAKLRRFLSPDNFVQDPYNTQNFNRYAYVLNNPLTFSDPSGELGFLAIVALAAATAITTNAIGNIINGTPWWYGAGKAGVSAAVITAATLGLGIGGPIPDTFSQYLGDAAIGVLGEVLPSLDIKIGDWSVSLNAVLLSGEARGIGAAVAVGYHSGNFNFSYGFGVTHFNKHYATGKKGFEFRNSFKAGWDDGKTGFSLGTNFWSGSGEMSEFKQQTGVLSIRQDVFRFNYENDGFPFAFGKKEKNGGTLMAGDHATLSPRLGDGGDSYRTAAASIGIGDLSVGFNLFTGKRVNYNEVYENGVLHHGTYGERYPNGYVREEGTPYRLGALYIRYQSFRLGINSDRHVRHPIQDHFAHNFGPKQPGFRSLSDAVLPYIQYQTPNSFTSW